MNLTGVTNAQRIVLDLTNVNDGINVGDASSDVAFVQSMSGTALP